MDTSRAACWTLEELSRLAHEALAVDYAGAASGRVRDRPDPRTIRYYTTLGLLDRPAAFRGRTALYARRHLLQLVAVKRLQAEGLSLRDVQERLLGLTDRKLEALARVPEDLPLPDAAVEVPAARADVPPESPRRSFWKDPAADAPPSPDLLQTVPLGGGALLLLPWPGPLTPADLHALRAAAQPLVHLLETRRPPSPR